MKPSIVNQIQKLGGHTEQVKGESMVEDLLSITFTIMLREKQVKLSGNLIL